VNLELWGKGTVPDERAQPSLCAYKESGSLELACLHRTEVPPENAPPLDLRETETCASDLAEALERFVDLCGWRELEAVCIGDLRCPANGVIRWLRRISYSFAALMRASRSLKASRDKPSMSDGRGQR
jgi:hypothetical protein